MLDERVGAQHGAVDGIEAALAVHDGTGRIDDGDARSTVEAERGQAHLCVLLTLDHGTGRRTRVSAARLPQLVADLILVGDTVNQPRAEGRVRQKRPEIDQGPDLG